MIGIKRVMYTLWKYKRIEIQIRKDIYNQLLISCQFILLWQKKGDHFLS